ncbi:MAG: hypothetical protein Q9211_001633 [Gyalolechia sp. 1 TL-2023]
MDDNALEIEKSELEIIVPQATGLNLEESSSLSSIQLRSSLHFVQAFGPNNRTSDGQDPETHSIQSQSRDVIWSGVVDKSQEPVRTQDRGKNTLVWPIECFLNRPRVRMQHPMIAFKATANFKYPPPTSEESIDPILPSGVPASINVLEPLRGDPGLYGISPQLTALRLDRINIKSTLATKEHVIRSLPHKPFPALPAISARVRYSKAGAYTGRPSIVASLDIETTPFQEDEIELTHVNLELSDGSAEDLCKHHAINLPMTCQPRDNIVFLFRLLPDDIQIQDSKPDSPSQTLDISIDARVLVSETCRPSIQMRWKTVVDFVTALNTKFGSPIQAMQRSKRPSNLLVTSDTDKRLSQEKAAPSDTTEVPPPNTRASSLDQFGITLTLTAPKDVHVGQAFTWDLFLVNHSSQARKLAILVIPKRKTGHGKTHMSKTSAFSSAAGQAAIADHADAVMDENRLYAMQKGLGREDVEIVCLSTEVRLGTLNPGFCHNTELKFLPLAKGILHIEAVRVVDLVENKSADVRDLPEIVAEARTVDE